MVRELGVQMVVFDDDLSPVQVRNLEKTLEIKVLDRTRVILDIFAAHARSIESRTQVELAQLQYLLPRLTRMWTHLSKQFGGVGTKGPGETQIETDRRLFRGRIQRLKERLHVIETQRSVQRKGRTGIPRFALVGYTNAGKSSLMRSITNADVHIEDKLFATLDTTVRGFELPSGREALISDTVGFIRKLPHQLVASFRSTLTETLEADVLLHVIDASSPHAQDHIRVVDESLTALSTHDQPRVMVFNKIDLCTDRHRLADLADEFPGAVFVSARNNTNISTLLNHMQSTLERLSVILEVLIPYSMGGVVSQLYATADVLERSDNDIGTFLRVKVDSDKLQEFEHRYGNFITATQHHQQLSH